MPKIALGCRDVRTAILGELYLRGIGPEHIDFVRIWQFRYLFIRKRDDFLLMDVTFFNTKGLTGYFEWSETELRFIEVAKDARKVAACIHKRLGRKTAKA